MNRRVLQGLGCWALALSQLFWSVGCRQTTGGAAGSGAQASTVAGASAGVNLGQIVYDLLHHSYETSGMTARADALEVRHDDFVTAINRIFPQDVSNNLFDTLRTFMPLVDEGAVEAAAGDVDAIVQELLNDPAALDALVTLMNGAPTTAAPSYGDRSRDVLVSRLLAYPELENLVRGVFELVQNNDGVDDQGQPNGERNLLRELQSAISRNLLAYQPASATASTQGLTQGLQSLSDALLANQPLRAFPDLGAPAWAVHLDRNGNPKVLADPATGRLPFPFVDRDQDGTADVDTEGRPIDPDNHVISLAPFGTSGTRDSYGRAVAAGGALYYDYYDAKRTLLCEVLLLVGELVKRNVPDNAVTVLDAVVDRVPNDAGTPGDASDDYETLSTDSPLLDLTFAQFELVRRTPLPELLSGLAEVVQHDPQKFCNMLDSLLVAIERANTAAHSVPAAGANQAMMNDLMPMVEDVTRNHGRGTSAMRALLQAFNSEQRRLGTLPAAFARMMRWHDYGRRIPADATHKSVMQRVLEMMERANSCNTLGINQAELYLDAMAGNARVLGISISIDTINKLLDISFLRSLLCSSLQADDVRALKDFNDTGALEAMKPIARVFSSRGETVLLKNIMLALGRHHERAMRPIEPMVVAVLESGAVEQLFQAIDLMTQIRVPSSNEAVADVLADTIAVLVDSTTPIYDRRGQRHTRLLDLLNAPMTALSQRAQQRNVGPQLQALTGALGEVLLQTFNDDNGTPDPADDRVRWKWSGLKSSLGELLAFAARSIPQAQADRDRWCSDQQAHMEQLLTGRDVILVVDVLKTIAACPQKPVITAAIANLFTPRATLSEDVFGAILCLLADGIARKPQAVPATVNTQALATVLHFVGRQLDPALGRFDAILDLIRRVIAADDGLLLLRIARNAYSMGPAGTDEPPVAILSSVFADISAAGGAGAATTVDSLKAELNKIHNFINDTENGLPSFCARIKARAH